MRLAAWAVVLAELIALLWLTWLYSRHGIVISVEKGADVATLVLTASAVVVTGVGVAVAVVAVWGFRDIRERAVEAAIRAAREAVAGDRRQAFDQGRASPEAAEADQIAAAMEGDPP